MTNYNFPIFIFSNLERKKNGRRAFSTKEKNLQQLSRLLCKTVTIPSPRLELARAQLDLALAAGHLPAPLRRDAEDGAVLVHRRRRRRLRHRRGVAAVPPRRLELLRRRPHRRLLLLPAPLRHRGRRPLRQRHRLRHLQRDEQGRVRELPGRDGRVPVGEGAHVLRPLPRRRRLLRLHRLHALPPRHGARPAEVRHLLHARLRAHHRLPLRAQGARQPARSHDLQGEATVYTGLHWMHGWHDLCLYGSPQLFSVSDILDPSGSGTCLLHNILLPRRLQRIKIPLVKSPVTSIKYFRPVTHVG